LIFYVFLDGVGLGENNPEKNPFARFPSTFFSPMGGGANLLADDFPGICYVPTDASMGYPGLPQSATGQTAIWTGVNGSEALGGRHLSGFPTVTLRKIISEKSILKTLNDHGKKAYFLNCYTSKYKQHMIDHPKLVSASTLVQIASGLPLHDLDDLRAEKGIYMDITHEILKETAKDELPDGDELFLKRDPYQVGFKTTKNHESSDLCLYEYFLTDKIGHAQDWTWAEKVIQTLDQFFHGILAALDPKRDQLIVISDHGNMEDLSVGVHTKNKVACVLYGRYTNQWKERIHSLVDIVPLIYEELLDR
jgi:hypothetical protein